MLQLLLAGLSALATLSAAVPTTTRLGEDLSIQRRDFNLSAGLSKNEHGPFCFTQRISHFEDGIDGTYCQRYTVDKKFYKEGGPVLLLVGGESADIGSGSVENPDDLTFEYHIAKEHHALVVTLEHRYYGYSQPMPDHTTDSLRFLSVDEALEDAAQFIRNFPVPEGLVSDPALLKPKKTPWILYGGSYPGALVAWMRGKYPDLVWATIASSAVIGPNTDDNGYLWTTAMGKWGDPACIKPLEDAWTAIDHILDKNDTAATDELFGLWGLKGFSPWRFAQTAEGMAMYWQSREWGAPENSTSWWRFCEKMKAAHDNITIGGESVSGAVITLRDTMVSPQALEESEELCKNYTSVAECWDANGIVTYLSPNVPPSTEINMQDGVLRPWLFQSCRELGLKAAGPPEGSSEPRVASRYWTPQGYDELCRHWYPPGEHFQLAGLPDGHLEEEFGGLNFTYPRIAWVAGEWDPWYFAIPQHASTPDNPSYVIPKGGHMWDKVTRYNLSDEPEDLQKVHRGLLSDVGRWLKEFEEQKC